MSVTKERTVKDIISAVVAANCNLPLAAERLGYDRNQTDEIIKALVADKGTLNEQLRTALILQLFNTFMETQLCMRATMGELTAGELSRAYSAQAQALNALMSKPTEEVDEQPVSIADARERLVSRISEHIQRAASGDS